MFPFGILRVWVLGVPALAQVLIATWFCVAWLTSDAYPARYLVQGLGMLVASFIVPLALAVLTRLHGKSNSSSTDPLTNGESKRLLGPNDARLYVEFHGAVGAPLLVLTHAWSVNHDIWPREVVERLASQFRVVLWDLPGLGRSTAGTHDVPSAESLAAALHAVINDLPAGPVLLVGHSLGGAMLTTYGRLYADKLRTRIAGLVLIDATYTNPLHTARYYRLLTHLQRPVIEPLLRLTMHLSPLVKAMNWLSHANGSLHLSTRLSLFATPRPWRQIDQVARLLVHASPRHVAAGLLAALSLDEQATLAALDLPVLLISGTQDRWTPRKCQRTLRAMLSQAEWVAIPMSSHLPFLEDGSRVVQAIEAWYTHARPPAESENRETQVR